MRFFYLLLLLATFIPCYADFSAQGNEGECNKICDPNTDINGTPTGGGGWIVSDSCEKGYECNLADDEFEDCFILRQVVQGKCEQINLNLQTPVYTKVEDVESGKSFGLK